MVISLGADATRAARAEQCDHAMALGAPAGTVGQNAKGGTRKCRPAFVSSVVPPEPGAASGSLECHILPEEGQCRGCVEPDLNRVRLTPKVPDCRVDADDQVRILVGEEQRTTGIAEA